MNTLKVEDICPTSELVAIVLYKSRIMVCSRAVVVLWYISVLNDMMLAAESRHHGLYLKQGNVSTENQKAHHER